MGEEKRKSKSLTVHAKKGYRGNRGITPLILNLDARWWWVVEFTALATLTLESDPDTR